MALRTWVGAALIISAASTAQQASARPTVVLEPVTTKAYEAQGTHQEIARRGTVCMTQILKPGVITAPTILSSDPESGQVVANNVFTYPLKMWGTTSIEKGRATTTLETKDGRFRLVFNPIEMMFSDGWRQARAWSDAVEADPIRLTLLAMSDEIAACISRPAAEW